MNLLVSLFGAIILAAILLLGIGTGLLSNFFKNDLRKHLIISLMISIAIALILIALSPFYESLIDISIIYGLYNKYVSLINNFNETFFFLFEIEKFPINPMNIKFLNTYKFLAIFNISLIFLAKDKNLYEENILKIKELLEKYICICIKTIDYKKLDSPKINNFITQIKFLNENLSLIDLSNEIVDILFGKKLNEYKKLRKCIKQLIVSLRNLKRLLRATI